jgi:alpha-tubulin suppressor-like RCC1 family protein
VKIKNIYPGSYHTLFLSQDEKLYGCGDNRNGQLGIATGVDSVHTITYLESLNEMISLNRVDKISPSMGL